MGVVVCRHVLTDDGHVQYAYHYQDGDWLFHCGGEHGTDDGSELTLICLEDIADHDPTILELDDLPRGWDAERQDHKSVWKRSPCEPAEGEEAEHVSEDGKQVRIFTDLDGKGKDTLSTESFWCMWLGDWRFVLGNVPFFAANLNFEDVVEARTDACGRLLISRVVRRSGNRTEQIAFVKEDELVAASSALARLGGLGCIHEISSDSEWAVSVSIPRSADDVEVNSIIQEIKPT